MDVREIKGRKVWRWTLTADTVPEPTEGSTALSCDDFQVHVFGNFDGAKVEIMGSLADGGDEAICHERGTGAPLSFGRTAIAAVAESPRSFLPKLVDPSPRTGVVVVIVGEIER